MVTALLASDPAVPQRDALLDTGMMGELLASRLTGAPVASCLCLNVKYRVGESLRVAYRIETRDGSDHIAARTFPGERSATVYRRATAAAVPAGRLPSVVHVPELGAVLWTFPNDRKLCALPLLAGPSPALDRLVGGHGVRTRVINYAPEQSATAQCLADDGHVLAYAKVHRDGTEYERRNVEAVGAAVGETDRRLRVPRVLAGSAGDEALVLEPLEGRRLDTLSRGELGPALRRLGAALARLHEVRPLPPRRFAKLDGERLCAAAAIIGRARPDCREPAERVLAAALRRAADAGGPAVHLHGDANLRNALLQDDRIALVDMEDATAGPAATDLGSVLAGLAVACLHGRITVAERRAMAIALLRGYAGVRAVPDTRALRWHTAAALLARVALPAIGRVRPDALGRLRPLLETAGGIL